MPSYRELEEALAEAIRAAEQLEPPRLEGEPLIAASRGAEPPAQLYYIGLLHGGNRAILATPSEVAFHLTPYREYQATLVGFTVDPKDTRLLHAVEAALTLGLKAVVTGPPMHPAYESRLEELGAERVRVEARHPLLAMAVTALHWVPRLHGFREERYRRELGELAGSAGWAGEEWDAEIRAAREEPPAMAYYTFSTRPGAYYYCRLHPGCREPLPLEAILEESRGASPLVFLSTVEEQSYKDVMLAASVKGVKPVLVKINTDPITAGFYAMLVAASMLGRIA